MMSKHRHIDKETLAKMELNEMRDLFYDMQRDLRRGASVAKESWRLFRILGEFVDGFDVMGRIGPAISIFGSARTLPNDPVYAHAEKAGRLCVEKNFGVITGGGPGVMEAANKGAFEADGHSVGLNIDLPFEQEPNAFQTEQLDFRYFFVRKVMFVKYAVGFIVFPGGFGTLDELAEKLNSDPNTQSTGLSLWFS